MELFDKNLIKINKINFCWFFINDIIFIGFVNIENILYIKFNYILSCFMVMIYNKKI